MAKMNVEYWKTEDVKPYENNPRINDGAVEATANSIKEFGWQQPIVVDKNGVIIVGHTRLKAAKKLKLKQVPVIVAENLTDEQAKAYRLADNKTGELADWDVDMLDDELNDILNIDMVDFGFENFAVDFENGLNDEQEHYSLADKYIVNPFTVLDARMGNWINRKRAWLALGIKSEEGRDSNLSGASEATNYQSGTNSHVAPATSIFDPVLCEIMYRWFNVEGGSIIDPFSGGSVRGIVAKYLGYDYHGNDLRKEQIDANVRNAHEVLGDAIPTWSAGDSTQISKLVSGQPFDMLFTCPPYADLEVYSDDEHDISNMNYDDFLKTYRTIISESVSLLKQNRFAVIVVGEARGKNGMYYGFVKDTVQAFQDAGMDLYNEFSYVTPNGTAGMRADRTFGSMRKAVKTHQNVLVFYKGDQQEIKSNYQHIEVANLNSDDNVDDV